MLIYAKSTLRLLMVCRPQTTEHLQTQCESMQTKNIGGRQNLGCNVVADMRWKAELVQHIFIQRK